MRTSIHACGTATGNLYRQGLGLFFLDDVYRFEAGVVVPADAPAELSYGLVDLQDGERPTRYWIGTANFYAITQYNRSFFYAMAVIDLGQAVGQQRVK